MRLESIDKGSLSVGQQRRNGCALRGARLGWYKGSIFHNSRLQPLANQTEDATVANVVSFLPVSLLADEQFTGKQGLQYAVGISVMLLPEWEASTPRKTRSDRLKILSDILEQPVKI